MDKNITLTDDNLVFRLPKQDDVDCLVKLKNNKVASRLLGGNTPTYTREGISKWVDAHNANQEELLFVVIDSYTNKVIGHVGLYDIDRIAGKTEYGILLADDESRGKGYGTKCTKTMVNYAFNTLKLHKVTAEVLDENIVSKSMFTKCGFSIDGVLREHVFKNGRYYNVLAMSILDREFNCNTVIESSAKNAMGGGVKY